MLSILCCDRSLCANITFLDHKSIHKDTRVDIGTDDTEVKKYDWLVVSENYVEKHDRYKISEGVLRMEIMDYFVVLI